MPMQYDRTDGTLVIHPEGRINSADAPEFRASLDSVTQTDDQAVILNMESLTYISSGGLRILLEFAQELNKRGSGFAICSLSSSVRDVFRISGLDRVVTICASPDEAVAAVSP